jgi:O-antigen/teichoic acid export membrane protein
MNTLQRLLSNTFLAFLANVVVRASTSLLFILIGRNLGPTESGVFTLGTTYFTIVFGLSALGLHELLVRELSPRRDESAHYVANYLAIRLATTVLTYLLLVVALRLVLPYNAETERVILILSLAALPEAVFSICQALFESHEMLVVPTVAALINSGVKVIGGFVLLRAGAGVTELAWLMVLGSTLSLLAYPPGLVRLFRQVPQRLRANLDWAFSRAQLRETPGFFTIHLFSLLDYQTDAFLISLLLTETELGYYTAALTITLAISMLSFAVRAAIYPVMARYARTDPDKLVLLHEKANQYLLIFILPVAAGVALLADPIIRLIYGDAFAPAIPVLRISVWASVFLLLNVPNARLMLIHNRQRAASGVTALSMGTNVVANLLLIPVIGIIGSAIARLLSSIVFFLSIHLYVRRNLLETSFLPGLPRPLLATTLMAAAVWPLRELPLPVPILAGVVVYGLAAAVLRVVPRGDIVYWQQIVRARSQ